MATDAAFDEVQAKVVLAPAATLAGVAVIEMIGTGWLGVRVEPKLLVPLPLPPLPPHPTNSIDTRNALTNGIPVDFIFGLTTQLCLDFDGSSNSGQSRSFLRQP